MIRFCYAARRPFAHRFLLPLLLVWAGIPVPPSGTILDRVSACLDLMPVAHAEEPDAHASNWQRLCVLGWSTVVERVLSQSNVEASTSWTPVKGKGLPLLVRREDNDLVIAVTKAQAAAPDSVNDAVLVDYDADGTVDRAVEWDDLDLDGFADRQVIYALTPSPWHPTQMACILIEQHDNDGALWHLVRWQYMQNQCQWSCDFSGNGFFTAAHFDDASGRWTTFDENPFCFYDRDEDGFTDEVLRLSGENAEVRTIRWSFDLDHDAGRISPSNPNGSPYDYDLSITAVGRVVVPPADRDTLKLRPTDALCGRAEPERNEIVVVAYDRAREAAAAAKWEKVLLTFDENDRNIDPADSLAHERWEGVIAEEVPGFPAVGGPPCGFSDKRYEVDRDAYLGGPIAFYQSPYDQRLHLFGAEWGAIEHDEDGDGRRDELLRTEDRDHDGFFDTWLWDGNADGTWDIEWHPTNAAQTPATFPLGSGEYFDVMRKAEAPSATPLTTQSTAAQAPVTQAPVTQAQRYAAMLASWRAGKPPLSDR